MSKQMKKFIVIIALQIISAPLIGCEEEEVVNIEELHRQGYIYVVPRTQKPYSGKFVSINRDNTIGVAGSLKNGKFHGEITIYNRLGGILKVETYNNGVTTDPNSLLLFNGGQYQKE